MENRNKIFQNSEKYCQNVFVGHRFGTNFFDIGEITISANAANENDQQREMFLELQKKENEIKRLKIALENSEKKNNELIAENHELRQRIEKKEENSRKRKYGDDNNSENDQKFQKHRRIE